MAARAKAVERQTPEGPELVRRDPRSLHPHPKNSRRHDRRQIDALKKSLEEFGVMRPILVDEGDTVLAGHGVREAAIELGLAQVDVVVHRGLTEDQKRAYLIVDNRMAELSSWDQPILRAEIEALADASGLSAFDVADLFGAKRKRGATDPDAIPDKPPRRAELGHLWQLGEHRLICGDATDAATVKRVLEGLRPNLMVTDPPYGVDYDPGWRAEALGIPVADRKIANDHRSDWGAAYALFPGDIAFVWHGGLHADTAIGSLRRSGFIPRAQIVWVKPMVIGRGHYHWRHEPCFMCTRDGEDVVCKCRGEVCAYCVREGGQANWRGSRSESTVWEVGRDLTVSDHSTQKPVEVMRRPIICHTDPGDWVYEPFAGTGTTIIAAEQSGRRCAAIELVPECADIAIERWQQFTGREAVLS